MVVSNTTGITVTGVAMVSAIISIAYCDRKIGGPFWLVPIQALTYLLDERFIHAVLERVADLG